MMTINGDDDDDAGDGGARRRVYAKSASKEAT